MEDEVQKATDEAFEFFENHKNIKSLHYIEDKNLLKDFAKLSKKLDDLNLHIIIEHELDVENEEK